jgi:hypothetical protein
MHDQQNIRYFHLCINHTALTNTICCSHSNTHTHTKHNQSTVFHSASIWPIFILICHVPNSVVSHCFSPAKWKYYTTHFCSLLGAVSSLLFCCTKLVFVLTRTRLWVCLCICGCQCLFVWLSMLATVRSGTTQHISNTVVVIQKMMSMAQFTQTLLLHWPVHT